MWADSTPFPYQSEVSPQLHIGGAGLLTLATVVLGLALDRIHWHVDWCSGWRCHWFQRSGAFIVLYGAYLAFNSGAVLIKRLPVQSEVGETGRDLLKPNPK